jgi:membrane protease YdiL (CAAX protease family)
LTKNKIRLLGLVTLFVFPLPSYLWWHFYEKQSLSDFLQVKHFSISSILSGTLVGILFAFIINNITNTAFFQKIPLKVEKMIREMHLSYLDALFLSICAGVGEELLFRSGIQPYLGVILTSIIFVAIHGYFSIKQPAVSFYGLLVLPFIVVIGYGFVFWGVWFSIFAHLFYDLTLFIILIGKGSGNDLVDEDLL